MTRKIIAIRSDIQGGSSYGLLNPKTMLCREDKEGNPFYAPVQLNPIQEYLWEIDCEAREKVFALAGNDEIVYIENGDMTQGNHFSDGLVSGKEVDHVQIAVDCIVPWIENKNVRTVRLTKSTGVHAFREHSADVSVTNDLKRMYPKKDIRLVGHGRLNVGGVLIDYAHHGPPAGVRSWLKGNLMRYEVKSIMDTCMKDGREVPHIIARAHKHERVEEWVTEWRMDERVKCVGITTPPMQMLNEHARKVTSSEQRVTHGMVAIEVEDGRVVDVHWFAKTKYIPVDETL